MRKIILATLILGICSVVFAVGCQNSSDKIWAPKPMRVVQEKEIDTREIMDEWERYWRYETEPQSLDCASPRMGEMSITAGVNRR